MTEEVKTILIVEDQALVLMAITSYLAAAGYRVLSAARPSQALRLSDELEGRLDLLLSDVAMPEMEGPELARELLARRPGLPVLYMSAHYRDDLIEAGRLEPDARLLQKPVSRQTLVSEVQRLFVASERAPLPAAGQSATPGTK